jgi:electron transfer flavoprotein alpha subunit
MENILILLHVEEAGGSLSKSALEVVAAGVELGKNLNARLTIGIIGDGAREAAASVGGAGARILTVYGSEFSRPRYASDAAAAEALCKKAEATLVLSPASSRFNRVLPGVAHRLQGCIDTHVTAMDSSEGICVTRWFYKQRIEGKLLRSARPWLVLLEAGIAPEWHGDSAATDIEAVEVIVPVSRTRVLGIRAPKLDEQTIRPDAKLLFVAGAGWTKKQADGQFHAKDAESLIKDTLRLTGASLGSSKSLVDQSADQQSVLSFMSHLNQVGQTGSTPRHPKGLSTCCHGEEPHVVGWRFINERRAINLDPNCGWARGKADVLYVADAFQVIEKLLAILAEKSMAMVAR